MQEVKKQAEAGTKETKEAIAALDERLKRVESGWGIDYKHDAVLGLCYMGAAYMSQHYERTVETAVLWVIPILQIHFRKAADHERIS